MTERLLQYIWQFRYFNHDNLEVTTGEPFHVIYPGALNTNQGPDFLEARIQLGNTLLAGHVELHLKTSMWLKHAHHADPNYQPVVLHVVWENDVAEPINDIPVFVLQDRVPKLLLNQYDHWMNSQSFIACQHQVSAASELTWSAWKERLLVERLQRKTATVFTYLQQNNQHWEETLWWMLARHFGNKVNAPAFEAIARSVPLNIVAKHKEQLIQLEALFMGQAGLLRRSFAHEYPNLLKREYQFYKTKYKLPEITATVHFLRMRPVSFPTLRLAQLARLMHQSSHLFTTILEHKRLDDVRALLDVTASEFWDHHYTFHETAAFKPKKVGEQVADSIIINTIIPVLFAYGQYHHYEEYRDRALQWMSEIPSEKNRITAGFEQLGIANNHAADSQALIELKTCWCDQKKCLHCAVGNALMKANLQTT